jgi:glutamine synthetase
MARIAQRLFTRTGSLSAVIYIAAFRGVAGTIHVTKSLGFIAGTASGRTSRDDRAAELERRIATENLHLVRLAWADPHGVPRAKAVTMPAFLAALETGYNINVATTTLDPPRRTFARSRAAAGWASTDDRLTQSRHRARSFHLPRAAVAPGVGWVLCDEYFGNGVPFHFSPRQLLRRAVERLAGKGLAASSA